MLITDRDMEILEFINDFGFCEMPQIEKRFGLKKPRGYKIIKRLINAGLIVHEYVLRNRHGIYRLTRAGAEFSDLPILKYFSLGSYLHQLTVVDVYLKLIQRFPDAIWISERRLKRDQFLEKGFYKRGHVADGMLIFPDEKKIAVEVELTMKGKDRLKKIIRGYSLDSSIACVWYYCAPNLVKKIKNATNWLSDVRIYELGNLNV